MKHYLKAYVEKAEENGVLSVAVASDSKPDRDNERILPDAWDFKNFMKNPVLLWAHDYRSTPIGRVENISKDGNRILFQPKFAIDADISGKARQVFELFKAGFLNAFSVGFIPREWEDKPDAEGKTVRTFTNVELLEISAVPVPANPRALVLAREMKGVDESFLKQMELAGEEKCVDCGANLTNENVAQRSVAEGKTELVCLECISVKSVVPFKDYGTMPVDTPWSGPKEISAAGDDVLKLRRISTWFDSAKPELKASYKLPHHRADDLKAVFRGVAAAMAALMGARGGVDIPEGDRKGVYNHLAKHYRQFEKEPPDFKLIEAQVLKDVDLDVDMAVVVNVVKADEKEMAEMKKDIDQLKSLAVNNGTEGPPGSGPEGSKVDPLDALVSEQGTRQLVRLIDKSAGEILRRIRQASV